MDSNDEALQILLIVRRRLLGRMASAVVENRDALLNGSSRTNNPLAANTDLIEITKSLGELDNAIAGLAELDGEDLPLDVASPQSSAAQPSAATAQASCDAVENGIFSAFTKLVAEDKPEAASHELARVLHIPLDRVITATRFYARASKANPDLADGLRSLHTDIADIPEAEGVRRLIKTFGFQAVESRMALHTLLTRASQRPAIAAAS